tara:strand:- start:16 stop:198 length:183 start_codon:yes stop_codon:yes gene_type:complete
VQVEEEVVLMVLLALEVQVLEVEMVMPTKMQQLTQVLEEVVEAENQIMLLMVVLVVQALL